MQIFYAQGKKEKKYTGILHIEKVFCTNRKAQADPNWINWQ